MSLTPFGMIRQGHEKVNPLVSRPCYHASFQWVRLVVLPFNVLEPFVHKAALHQSIGWTPSTAIKVSIGILGWSPIRWDRLSSVYGAGSTFHILICRQPLHKLPCFGTLFMEYLDPNRDVASVSGGEIQDHSEMLLWSLLMLEKCWGMMNIAVWLLKKWILVPIQSKVRNTNRSCKAFGIPDGFGGLTRGFIWNNGKQVPTLYNNHECGWWLCFGIVFWSSFTIAFSVSRSAVPFGFSGKRKDCVSTYPVTKADHRKLNWWRTNGWRLQQLIRQWTESFSLVNTHHIYHSSLAEATVYHKEHFWSVKGYAKRVECFQMTSRLHNLKSRSISPKFRAETSQRPNCCFWIVLFLYSCWIYWFGLMSGLFACHHGFDLTAQELSASLLMSNSISQGANDELSATNLLRPDQLKLPTPIIVMGLMKAGTTSIYGYFKCGLDPNYSKLSHYNCNSGNKGLMSCGKRMRRNITKMKTKAFATMDMFTVYAELDGQEKNGGITVPQWQFVQGRVILVYYSQMLQFAHVAHFRQYPNVIVTQRFMNTFPAQLGSWIQGIHTIGWNL